MDAVERAVLVVWCLPSISSRGASKTGGCGSADSKVVFKRAGPLGRVATVRTEDTDTLAAQMTAVRVNIMDVFVAFLCRASGGLHRL